MVVEMKTRGFWVAAWKQSENICCLSQRLYAHIVLMYRVYFIIKYGYKRIIFSFSKLASNSSHQRRTFNPGQNIWNKIEKSSKTGQDKRSLLFTFACFFHCYCQSLISGRETGRWAMFPHKFEILLIFPNLLNFQVFFFLVWALRPAQRWTCRGRIFSVKMSKYKLKGIIYNLYTIVL